MRFALVGQPNCGKSTLFNQVAGYRAETGNFPGTTVTFTASRVRVLGQVVEIVDLPGTYTLSGSNPAERVVLRYLASHDVDAIINVVDATHLEQGLGMTMELLELQRPIVVAINVLDEAARLGLKIDGPGLAEALGAPVYPLVASKGRGVRSVFTGALDVAARGRAPARPRYSQDIEAATSQILQHLDGVPLPLSPEAVAIKLLEGDAAILEGIPGLAPSVGSMVDAVRSDIEARRGKTARWVLSAERHGLAGNLEHAVCSQGPRRTSWRDRVDDLLLHPVGGYLALVVILLGFFEAVYALGNQLERPLLRLSDAVSTQAALLIPLQTLPGALLAGLLQGLTGGVAIVLPYLVPFLLGLALLEDVGYLPRVAFLMDALMHRLGLHGKAVVPFILGYGCSVPAVMSTRILEDRRDRVLAAALSTMVPCAARLAVVFGLVAYYLGPRAALGIYVFNLFAIAVTGRILMGLLPEDSPGMILEMPAYRPPTFRTLLPKTWYRVREFVVEAWPVLIAGSAVLSLLVFFNVIGVFNLLVRPLTWTLGLPSATGVPLAFGILRKELSLIMLRQALGGADFAAALSPVQMVTFSVFVVFYVPCVATLAALRRELGWRSMVSIALLTVVVALAAAQVARGAVALLGF